MHRHPFANALHRHLLARNTIALNEHAADRGIGVTVVRIVVDAQRRAVLEDYSRRAFSLGREDRLELQRTGAPPIAFFVSTPSG